MSDAETPVSGNAPVEPVDAQPQEAPAKPRRRRRTKAEMEAARAEEAAARAAAEAAGEPWPPKRRRGRPRKGEQAAGDEMTKMTQEATQAASEPPPMTAQTLSAEGSAPTDAPRPRKRRRSSDHAAAQQDHQGQGRRQGGQGRRRNRRQDYVAEPSLTRDELSAMKVAELRTKAAELGVDYAGVRKGEAGVTSSVICFLPLVWCGRATWSHAGRAKRPELPRDMLRACARIGT